MYFNFTYLLYSEIILHGVGVGTGMLLGNRLSLAAPG